MHKLYTSMVAIIFCERDFTGLARTLDTPFPENVKHIILLGGDMPQKYEIPPKMTELQSSGNLAVFYNADMPETLTKVDAYLREIGADIWFFLRAGDTLHRLHTAYLQEFFACNSDGCGVVFAPVLSDGISDNLAKNDPRLPKEFCNMPRGGLFPYNKTFPQTLDGAAVWASGAEALDVSKGADAWLDLVEKTARGKGKFGRLFRVFVDRKAAKTVSLVNFVHRPNRSTYLVSCIIPIYNVEKYLEEAIESVVAQTIGFEDNVQLILVNDGSPDGCGEICKMYAKKYPANVVYIEQENRGVSAARNAGLDAAAGEFLAFLDGDDRYDENYFKEGVNFFRQHTEISFVAFPVECEDNSFDLFDQRIDNDRIIDSNQEPQFLKLVFSGLMFRCDELAKYMAETEVETLYNILGKNPKYYMSNTSRVFSNFIKKHDIIDFPRLSETKPASSYAQSLILYSCIQSDKMPDIREISGKIINASPFLSEKQKKFLLAKKDDVKFITEFTKPIRFVVVEEFSGIIRIVGTFEYQPCVQICIRYGDEFFRASQTIKTYELLFGKRVPSITQFEAEIPYSVDANLEFYAEIEGCGYFKARYNVDVKCRLGGSKGDLVLGDKTLLINSVDSISVRKNSDKALKIALADSEEPLVEAFLLQQSALGQKRIWQFDESARDFYEYCIAQKSEVDCELFYKTDNENDKMKILFAEYYIYGNRFKNTHWGIGKTESMLNGLCKAKDIYISKHNDAEEIDNGVYVLSGGFAEMYEALL